MVLVKTDLLPGPLAGRTGQVCTLTNNDSGRFIDRWIKLAAPSRKCIWTAGLDKLELPIAHGEGRYYADERTLDTLELNNQVIYRYCDEKGNFADTANPNGASRNIAGIMNQNGNVFGMMPHPERMVEPAHGGTDGRRLFEGLHRWPRL